MTNVYAKTEKGEKFLVYVQCDSCGARIKPNPNIANSGWLRTGILGGRIVDTPKGSRHEINDSWDYCEACSISKQN